MIKKLITILILPIINCTVHSMHKDKTPLPLWTVVRKYTFGPQELFKDCYFAHEIDAYYGEQFVAYAVYKSWWMTCLFGPQRLQLFPTKDLYCRFDQDETSAHGNYFYQSADKRWRIEFRLRKDSNKSELVTLKDRSLL